MRKKREGEGEEWRLHDIKQSKRCLRYFTYEYLPDDS